MRRFSLLLCLLVIAVLGWIIGSAEAPTTTQQRDAVVPKTHLTLEAVNTGFKDTSVATDIRTADAAWITYELLSAATEARPHSTNTILPIQSTRGFKLIVIETGKAIENVPPGRRSGLIGLDEPICNIA